jgi:uncharacterized iron-regulated protein
MNLPSLRRRAHRASIAFACALLAACATPARIDLDTQALTSAMARKPVALLGEVHDNAAQHAARATALRQLLRDGARPAIAFEQFDRERQADIDRARRESPPADKSRADYLIAQASPERSGWNWTFYRPYVELALEYDLPIVAANLSRADASRVANQGYGAVFDAAALAQLNLDTVPPAVLRAQERAIDEGHCNQLPAGAASRLARSQIARDAMLMLAIRPYFARGVVLLTGNGHARNDIGVPIHLTAAERARTVTIGLLENESAPSEWRARYDIVFITPTQTRPDPCATFKKPMAG